MGIWFSRILYPYFVLIFIFFYLIDSNFNCACLYSVFGKRCLCDSNYKSKLKKNKFKYLLYEQVN